MSYLTRAQIENAADIAPMDLDVPEWGGKVRIRPLAGWERDLLERSIVDAKPENPNYRAKLACMVLVNEAGERLFELGSIDEQVLGRKSAKALDRIYEAANRLSAIGQAAIESAEKNCAADQNGSSGFGSH